MTGSQERSNEYWTRAQRVIPMGVQTLSKSPTQFVQGVAPIYAQRAKGARLWDVDGNEWLDYPLALGPMILGYCDDEVDEAIRKQLKDGALFTLSHPIEIEVAERIVAMCPGVEAVRFAKSGSDALSAAVRAARAHTGRDLVMVAGYHGWHDWYIGSTSRASGVPAAVRERTVAFPFDDLDALGAVLDAHRDDIAAVVVEPSGATVPEPGYLESVVELARAAGAVSVFDEVITGFRVAPGGAREHYGVRPDISCYGKALGNGMPISAVAGRWDVMAAFEDVFFSGTHGGETLSLAAARVVLDRLADGAVLSEIAARGTRLRDAMRAAVHEKGLEDVLSVGGEPSRSVVSFLDDSDLVVKSFTQQRFLEAGILFNGSMFVSAAHDDDDIDRTQRVFRSICGEIESGTDLRSELRGEPVQPVFRAP